MSTSRRVITRRTTIITTTWGWLFTTSTCSGDTASIGFFSLLCAPTAGTCRMGLLSWHRARRWRITAPRSTSSHRSGHFLYFSFRLVLFFRTFFIIFITVPFASLGPIIFRWELLIVFPVVFTGSGIMLKVIEPFFLRPFRVVRIPFEIRINFLCAGTD